MAKKEKAAKKPAKATKKVAKKEVEVADEATVDNKTALKTARKNLSTYLKKNKLSKDDIPTEHAKKVKRLQNSITKLEKVIKEIDFELSINYDETISKPNFFDQYHSKKKELEKLMENWGVITEQIDAIH